MSYTRNTDVTLSLAGMTSGATCLAGTELIRRKLGKDASAMTITLLLNSEGKKMGKTQSPVLYGLIRTRHLHSNSISTGEMSQMQMY